MNASLTPPRRRHPFVQTHTSGEGAGMSLLVLLTPGAAFGLFWAMQRMEQWMTQGTPAASTSHTASTGSGIAPVGHAHE